MADPTSTVIASSASSAATTTVSFAAVAAGTLLTLHVSSDDYRATTGTGRPESSGWTLLHSGQDFLGAYLWYKVATGAETSVDYRIGSAVSSAYVVLSHTDIDTTGSPVDISAVGHGHGGATTTSAAAGTSTSGRRYAVASLHAMHSSVSITGASGWTNSYVELADQPGPTAGSREIVAVAGLAFNGGGATATTTATWAGSSQLCSYGITAVFKVAAGGPAPVTALASASVPRVASSIAGTVTAPTASGTLSASVPRTTSLIAGTVTPPTYSGTVSGTLPTTTGSMSGTANPPTYSGTLTAALPPTHSSIGGTVTAPTGAASLSGTLPRITGTLAGTVTAPTWTGTLGGEFPSLTGSILGTTTGPVFTGTLGGTLPTATGAISGTATAPTGSGTLTAALPALTGSLVGVVQVDDDLVPASARILTTAVRAPTARATSVRANSASGTLRTNTAQGRLR